MNDEVSADQADPAPAGTNRYPIDRMGVIKVEIAKLEPECTALRDQVVSGDVAAVGGEWFRVVSEAQARHIDLKAAEQTLP